MKIHWQKTVGGIVGYSRLGRDYFRSLASHVFNPQTESQMEHRAKFATVSKFMTGLSAVWRYGYRWKKGEGRSSATCMFSQIYDEAVTGNYHDGFTIDPTKVQMSQGNLTTLHSIAASVATATQTITVSWSDNTGVGNAEPNDQLSIMAYNPTKKTSMLETHKAPREAETASMTYPSSWAGDTIYVYAFLDNGQEAANSILLGFYTA